jgi:hypothetical protein
MCGPLAISRFLDSRISAFRFLDAVETSHEDVGKESVDLSCGLAGDIDVP